MTKFIIAPALKPFEDGMKAQLRVALHLAVNGDVARVPNLFRQVGGVKNVLGFEIGLLLGLG